MQMYFISSKIAKYFERNYHSTSSQAKKTTNNKHMNLFMMAEILYQENDAIFSTLDSLISKIEQTVLDFAKYRQI